MNSTYKQVWKRQVRPKLIIDGITRCWLWTGGKSHNGYGNVQVSLGGGMVQNWRVHRLLFFLAHGFCPKEIHHTCFRPTCCNPAHLEGTCKKLNLINRRARNRKDINYV